jgi:hypothetical protein
MSHFFTSNVQCDPDTPLDRGGDELVRPVSGILMLLHYHYHAIRVCSEILPFHN